MKKVKKANKKVLWIIVLCVLLCTNMTGCGSDVGNLMCETAESSYRDDEVSYGIQDNGMEGSVVETGSKNVTDGVFDAEMESKTVTDESTEETVTNGQKTDNMVSADGKKIIKNYYYKYETETFDDAYAYLKQQIQKYQGYVSVSKVEGTIYRTLNLTARIPAEISDEFAGSMGSLGTVISQSESAEDVTLQYTDTESRIAALKTEQERLNELLKKADNLESIIALEERLTEVRYELENYQSKKNLYDDLIAYSTVNITLEEVNYTVAVDDSTFLSRISTGLESSFRDIKTGLVDFLVAVIVLLPYLAIWGSVFFVVTWIIRRIIKRRKIKKQKKAEKAAVLNNQKEIHTDREKEPVVKKE